MLGFRVLTVIRTATKSILLLHHHHNDYPHRLFSKHSWLSVTGNPLIQWPTPPQIPPPSSSSSSEQQPQQNPNPNLHSEDCTTICNLLKDPTIFSGPALETALTQTGIKPDPLLLQTIFTHLDSSPKPLFTLFKWAEQQPSFTTTPPLFNSMIDLLGKSREFDSAWTLLLDRLNPTNGVSSLISNDTFAILIRRYSRAGMPFPAIRTFEFAQSLEPKSISASNLDLFEVLIDTLCKERNVKIAAEYCGKRRETGWIPSVRVYNIVLNGWFRSRKLKHAERLWEAMRGDNVSPTVVTYGTLVEGYCRMRRVERAMELIGEMRKKGIEPNSIVFNPIVDALGEEGRFTEALGMLERFSVVESGPTISTYNSLVKGFCKAKDLVGASKILKMMIERGFSPTPTTYNYFFRHFAQYGKIEEGMNLYTKMIESGYVLDRLTFHLLIKMLCEAERLELALQVSKEMRSQGCDSDLATSTMLVHLHCKLRRYEEACVEFEDMIRRGLIPQYLTYRKLTEELKRSGNIHMVRRLSSQMGSLPHSTRLPDTYREGGDESREKRSSIITKAKAISDVLKTTRNPRELSKMRHTSQSPVATANQLIEDIRRKISTHALSDSSGFAGKFTASRRTREIDPKNLSCPPVL